MRKRVQPSQGRNDDGGSETDELLEHKGRGLRRANANVLALKAEAGESCKQIDAGYRQAS